MITILFGTLKAKTPAESMPLVGGDIGCNVWVEKGDILLYLQRSGSFDENSEYLKMGRFRVKLNPNPFEGETYIPSGTQPGRWIY